ncbi:MAG: RHS repeat-associated core domain-containing protein [Planctomycetota bacterium]
MKFSKIISVLFTAVVFIGLFSSSVFARQYDPRTARFTQRDPISYVETAGRVQVGLYTYAMNNPVNFTDPTGLWTAGGHEYITQRAFRSFCIGRTINEDCKNWIEKTLITHNLLQDKGTAYTDMRRHYNRPLTGDRVVWDNHYGAYLKEEINNFYTSILPPPPYRCEEAMQVLGRLSHSWQDYFAHAIGIAETKAKNDRSFTSSPYTMLNATPDNRLAGLKPSSWESVWVPGEHGWHEFGGDEGAIRKTRAWAYVLKQYITMISEWLHYCEPCCPPKDSTSKTKTSTSAGSSVYPRAIPTKGYNYPVY